MPTLFELDGHRVVIFLNDHAPAHVHVLGEGRAKFMLGHGPKDVRLVEVDGIGVAVLRRVAAAIAARHAECLQAWERLHG